jgi:hypothetical protein
LRDKAVSPVTINGSELPTLGDTILTVDFRQNKIEQPFTVLHGKDTVVLGIDYINKRGFSLTLNEPHTSIPLDDLNATQFTRKQHITTQEKMVDLGKQTVPNAEVVLNQTQREQIQTRHCIRGYTDRGIYMQSFPNKSPQAAGN